METLIIKVPDVGEGIAEVELVSWAVEVGQKVQRNEVVAEVMTDKATVEVPSPIDGVVQILEGDVGDVLLVGSQLFHLVVDGEGSPEPAVTSHVSPSTPTPPFKHEPVEMKIKAIDSKADAAPTSPRPKATPTLRRRARDAGIDLTAVPGSGPAGRITHQDLDLFLDTASGRFPDPSQPGPGSAGRSGQVRRTAPAIDQPLIGLRRKIAERLVESANTIPHITYVEEVDVTELEDLRSTLNEQRSDDQPRLTLLPFLIRAITNEALNHPKMNAHVDDEAGVSRLFNSVHVGVATQTDSGLVVPVIHHAEAETLWSCASRLRSLTELTRAGKAVAANLSGSTITISSLGAIGGIVTTPVINKPEVAIVGVNKIVVRPVFIDGEFVPRKIMNLSSSFDHRVIDGWDAAQFIQALRAQLEQPALLFVDRV